MSKIQKKLFEIAGNKEEEKIFFKDWKETIFGKTNMVPEDEIKKFIQNYWKIVRIY